MWLYKDDKTAESTNSCKEITQESKPRPFVPTPSEVKKIGNYFSNHCKEKRKMPKNAFHFETKYANP
jgi:hypothetical protein